MPRDVLFLLPPGFDADGTREFCPECAEINGVLAWYPAIGETIDVVFVGLPHPRPELTALLGDGRHNAPTLVLHPETPRDPSLTYSSAKGLFYLPSARLIARHFAFRFGTPVPRGN